ncbi:peptidoglycan DD-metalloendopeptidase family protein [Streptomyces albidoflavus]|uniref:M23 family metallopeptidase n=1 Tax=Streptomyces albidoflavus TaxID=1886 RepID=UPI0036D29A25
MNDRHPSGSTHTPDPAPDADYTQYATYDQQNAQFGHTGYESYGAHAQDPGAYAGDPAYGSGMSGLYGNAGYATGAYDTGQYDATQWTDAGQAATPAEQHTQTFDPYAAQQTPYDTGTYDTSGSGIAYGTGTYDTTGTWATPGHEQANLSGTPAQTTGTWTPPGTYDATGQFETGQWDTTGQWETGQWDTTGQWDQATGAPAAAPEPDQHAFGTAAFETGQFETGQFEATQPFEAAQPFETAQFDVVQDATGYATGQFDTGEWQAAAHPADEAAPGEPAPAGRTDEDVAGHAYAAEDDTPDSYYDPYEDGDGAGDGRSATVGRQVSRGGRSSRRRQPAKRSALLTVAVPSVCVMGVTGIAAASVGDLGGDDQDKVTTQAAPEANAVKPAVANRTLDTQLTNLQADVSSFADRASRTQERIDLKERQEVARKKAAEEAARAERLRPKFALPVAQHGLSAYYGQAGINWLSVHTGIDFPVSHGTPVMAATDGTVRTQWNDAYGNMVIVTAKDGTETWYCHLSSTTMQSGEVKAGQTIGHAGTSGKSTGPHLHFEVRPGGGASIDPLAWFRSHGLDPQ